MTKDFVVVLRYNLEAQTMKSNMTANLLFRAMLLYLDNLLLQLVDQELITCMFVQVLTPLFFSIKLVEKKNNQ